MFALSKTVNAALQSEGQAQLRTMCAIALDLVTQPAEGLAAALFASPYWTHSKKTAANYATTANALFAKLGEQIANIANAEQDPSKAATRLAALVKGSIAPTTYQFSAEDIANWCANRPSMADKKKAKQEAEAAELAAIVKFNAETAAAQTAAATAAATATAEATTAQAEAAALRDAITAAQVGAAAADPISAPINPAIDSTAAEVKAADPLATPPAKPVEDTNPVVLSVRRNKAGELHIMADDSLTFDDYRNMAATLASMADDEEAAFDANAARLNAEAEAEAARSNRIAMAEACAV